MGTLGLDPADVVGPISQNPLVSSTVKQVATVAKQKVLGAALGASQFVGQRAADAQAAYEKFPRPVRVAVFGDTSPYKEYAKLYAGTLGSRCEEAHMLSHVFLAGQGSVENAELSGAMLRMYCDEKVDPEIIKRVGKSIESSKQYQYMAEWVEWKILDIVVSDAHHLPTGPAELQKHANTALTLLIRPKRPGVKPFYFGKEGLQPIIGGIGKLQCSSATILSSTPGTPAKPPVPPKNGKPGTPAVPAVPGTMTYALDVLIGDTYDFDNVREGDYDRFRKRLAALLKAGDYHTFEREYTSKLHAVRWSGGTPNDIDKGHVFAGYMYALEMAGIFKGFYWDVTLPMKGRLAYPIEVPPPPVYPLPDE
jgi:hypothetical protein